MGTQSAQAIVKPDTLSVPEAARRLGIGRTLAYELAEKGEIPAKRLGGRVVVLRAPFEKMLGVTE